MSPVITISTLLQVRSIRRRPLMITLNFAAYSKKSHTGLTYAFRVGFIILCSVFDFCMLKFFLTSDLITGTTEEEVLTRVLPDHIREDLDILIVSLVYYSAICLLLYLRI